MRIIFISLLAASALFGQDAKIIIVERGDTYELKQAYAKFKAARDHWEKVKTDVAKRYTVENGKTMEGWDRVEFSVDFRALVPAHQYTSGFNSWIINSSGQAINASSVSPVGDLSTDGVRSDVTVKDSPLGAVGPGPDPVGPQGPLGQPEEFVPAPLPPAPRSSVEDRSQMRGDITSGSISCGQCGTTETLRDVDRRAGTVR